MFADGEIRCGDAVTVLRELPVESVALTVTSPPYYHQRDYKISGQIGQEGSLDEYLSHVGEVLSEILRVTDNRGSCFFVVGDTYENRKLLLVPHRIAILATDVGWTVRNDLIWRKAAPAPESPRNRWRSGYEHIIFLTKQTGGYRFFADEIRVPYADQTLRRWGAGQSYGGKKSKDRSSERDSRMRDGQTFNLNPKGCIPTDVLTLASANKSVDHYAAFPESLVAPLIEVCSSPGDLVLDPFAGSGTTCTVARKLGRRFFGIELNPKYFELSLNETMNVNREQALSCLDQRRIANSPESR